VAKLRVCGLAGRVGWTQGVAPAQKREATKSRSAAIDNVGGARSAPGPFYTGVPES